MIATRIPLPVGRPGAVPQRLVHRTRAATTCRAAAAVALAMLLAGCDRGERTRDGRTRALAVRASGIWEAEFRLERTPRGAAAEPAPVVRGAVALIESAAGIGREWLQRPGTHAGVYDVDFRPFGFVPEPAGPVPTLVVAAVAPDTLLGATPTGPAGGTLVLRGVLPPDGDMVTGTWSYGSRAVGGWGGTFTLHARSPAP